MDMNSKHYWDGRFRTDWESAGGTNQTRAFMMLLLENLPDEICAEIEKDSPSILDWGCALGQGVDELQRRFPRARLTGLDFSETAIHKCKLCYPSGEFRSAPLDSELDLFDIMISSNCLEHFSEPLEVLAEQLFCTAKYHIILVPYAEKAPICAEHLSILTENSFPPVINGFTKCFQKVIDARRQGCWNGDQLLIIYRKNNDG